MSVIKDRVFVDRLIYVGGDTYLDCEFIRCEVVSSRYRGEMRHCRLIDGKTYCLGVPSPKETE